MKTCSRCGSKNKDSDFYCRDCMAPLTRDGAEQYRKSVLEREARAREEQARRQKLKRVMTPCVLAVYLVLYALALSRVGMGLFFQLTLLLGLALGAGYLALFQPEFLFRLGHLFTIRNLEDVELSDWYLISTKAGGVLALIAMLGFLIFMAFAP